MKRFIKAIISASVILSFICLNSCFGRETVENNPPDQFGQPFELTVDGKKCDAQKAYYKVYTHTWYTGETEERACIQLPFIEILRNLGVKVEKNKGGTYELSLDNGEDYKLSLSKK